MKKYTINKTVKRIFSTVIILCLMFSMLPTVSFAADKVTKIILTMDKPAVGKVPAASASVPADASTLVKSVKWYGELDAGGKFKPGVVYTVDIIVSVKEGIDRTIELTTKSNITLNGAKVTRGSVDSTGKTATLQYTYEAMKTPDWYADTIAPADKIISSVAVTDLTEPKQDAKPDKKVTVTNAAAFGTADVNWQSTGWDDTKVFDGLREYKVQVHLVLNKGFSFDEAIFNEGSVTINGKAATVRKGFNNTYIDIFYTFPKLDLTIEGNIKQIVINGMVPPRVNQKMATPKAGADSYTISDYQWSDTSDANGNYKADTAYKLTLTLTSILANSFNEVLNTAGKQNPRITISGIGVFPVVKSFSEKEMVLECNFQKATTYKGEKPAVMTDSPFVFAGGSGSYEDPYLIETPHQLNAVRKGLDKHYRLAADIDLSSWGNWIPIGSNEAYGGSRSGGANQAFQNTDSFTGSLDGNGHVISGMTIKIDAEEVYMAERLNVRYYGLFQNMDAGVSTGIIHDGGKGNRTTDPYSSVVRAGVRNLGMINYNIDIHHSIIKNDYEIYAGGISGTCHGIGVYNCYSAGGKIRIDLRDADDVKQLVRVGGLTGDSNWVDFRNCYNASDITVLAKSETGHNKEIEGAGISGTSIASWYMSCFNKGTITMPQYMDPNKGGTQIFAGTACGITVVAWAPDFPLLYHTGEAKNNYIWNCYNSGTLTGEFVGGIMLYSDSDYYLDNCYNAGVLNGSKPANPDTSIPTAYNVCWITEDIKPFGTEYIRRLYSDGSSISGDKWKYSSKLGRKVLSAIPEDSLTVPVVKTAVSASGGFSDVKAGAYYADAVKWAVDKSITSGTSATTFSPTNTCTRAQIITFMWRAVGAPKAASSNPFFDVKTSDYFYDAAVWASKNGMVTGKKFEGNTPCTRSSTVTYLWQNSGSPETTVSNTFNDVTQNAKYAKAVAWAVEKNITSGTSAATFSPDTICDRGQIVTFLNRALSAAKSSSTNN